MKIQKCIPNDVFLKMDSGLHNSKIL